MEYVHRVSWLLHGNDLPPWPAILMHTCDVRACCNPAHLRVGTIADNWRDCIDKGRSAKPPGFSVGQRNSRARLADVEVADLRRRFKTGERQRVLAAEYGLTEKYVSRLCSGARR